MSFDTKNRVDSFAHLQRRTAKFNVSKLQQADGLSHSDFGNRRVTLPGKISRFYECNNNRAQS